MSTTTQHDAARAPEAPKERSRPERVRMPLTPRRRRRRRRLLLGSLPVVVLLVLVAARLVSLNLVHAQTLAAYEAGDKEATLTWGERQGWVNVVEQFRSPFAIGDSYVLEGQFEQARPWFEQAFDQVPKGGIDECKVRVNLGLTYEALGDAAKARERTEEWKQFYDKGLAMTSQRPPFCDTPEGGDTGEALQQTQERIEEKNVPGEQEPQPGPGEPQQQPTPQPTPTPDEDNTPSEQEQEQLREQQRRNTIERNQQQGNLDPPGDDGRPAVPKPW